MSEKLRLSRVLAAIDQKDYDFYDRLDPGQQKQISPFLLNRYTSLVKGDSDLHAYYLMATNQRVNSNYFSLSKHPKLVWQLLCTCSPGMGKQFHQWVGHKKKKTNNGKIKQQLEVIYPNMKQDELDLISAITTEQELQEYNSDAGI